MKSVFKSTAAALLLAMGLALGACTPEDNTDPKPDPPPPLPPVPAAPSVSITKGAVTQTSVAVTFKPNETATGYAYAIGMPADQAAFEGGTIEGYTETSGEKTITFNDLTPDTEYTVFALAWDKDNKKSAVFTTKSRTEAPPLAQMTVELVGEVTESQIVIKYTGDDITTGFTYAIGRWEDLAAFEAGTLEGIKTVESISAGFTETWSGLTPATRYTFFARGSDGNGNPGETAALTLMTVDPNAPADKARCVGYLASWDFSGTSNPDNIRVDWSALTHINLAFYYPTSNGTMPVFVSDGFLKGIVAKAHENGIKVLASIRDCDSQLFATARSRKDFVTKIVEHAEKYNLDGIDSDLEKSEAGFWTNYEPFILELRKACSARGLLLTTAVSTWFSDNITDKTFACFDHVNMMAYDNEANGFEAHSTLKFAQDMAKYYSGRGIPADKIVVGVPFYGYPRNGTWNDGIAYKDILARYPDAWNADKIGTENYTYNGVNTIKQKSEFARGYGGVMIWHLGQDTQGEYSLLKVIKENLFEEGTAPRPVYN